MQAYAASTHTTVAQALTHRKHRHFVLAEQEYFRLWWDGVASHTQKRQVTDSVGGDGREMGRACTCPHRVRL